MDGKPNGKGCLKLRNGTILFDGVWANGELMSVTMNKPTCHVEIRNGAIWKGYCEVTFIHHGSYKGMFNNFKLNGKGLFTTFDGTKYSGIWANGLPFNVTRHSSDGRSKRYSANTPLLRSDVPFSRLPHVSPPAPWGKRRPSREKVSAEQPLAKRAKKNRVEKRKGGNELRSGGPAKQSRVDGDQRTTRT